MENPALQTFSPHVHETFVTVRGSESVSMVLVEASALGGSSTMSSFSLLFHSGSPVLHPQDVYRLEHPVLGEFDLFLVPVGRHETGFVYQAIFN